MRHRSEAVRASCAAAIDPSARAAIHRRAWDALRDAGVTDPELLCEHAAEDLQRDVSLLIDRGANLVGVGGAAGPLGGDGPRQGDQILALTLRLVAQAADLVNPLSAVINERAAHQFRILDGIGMHLRSTDVRIHDLQVPLG